LRLAFISPPHCWGCESVALIAFTGPSGSETRPRCCKQPRCLHLIVRGSSSLAFAASLMTFSRCRVGLQGFSADDPSALLVRATGSVPRGLCVTFKAPLVVLDRSSPIRLSWDSFSWCPAFDIPSCVHSPMTLPPSFGQSQPATDTFRPRGFAPPRRFTPRGGLWVCCAPKPNGVHCVSGYRARQWPTEADNLMGLVAFPAMRFAPFEEFRSSVAVPRHRGRCPLAVWSTPCHPTPKCRTRPGDAPTDQRCRRQLPAAPIPKYPTDRRDADPAAMHPACATRAEARALHPRTFRLDAEDALTPTGPLSAAPTHRSAPPSRTSQAVRACPPFGNPDSRRSEA